MEEPSNIPLTVGRTTLWSARPQLMRGVLQTSGRPNVVTSPQGETTREQGSSRFLEAVSGVMLLVVTGFALVATAFHLLRGSGHPAPALGPVVLALAAALSLSPIGAIMAVSSAWIGRKSRSARTRLSLALLSVHVGSVRLSAWLAHSWGWRLNDFFAITSRVLE